MKESYQKIIVLFIGLALGFMLGIGQETTTEPDVIQLNPDLRNQVQNLNTQVAVLNGQVSMITGRYNDHGARLEVIESKMRIFNND